MIYVGNKPENEAKQYKTRSYTHSKKVHGRMVKYYDCWKEDKDKVPPVFGKGLDKNKVKGLDKMIKDWKE